ncbi:uncharacterized protein LOC126267158 [Schistocerca gregaria]|uniref:uncharacterized protein LOC126267158 n=1 Tax=Schistocerca gregaria TaxID=7010 RepID=UPI00211EB81B|nr:uncharacterized protein LOC126267158 [Schistocerca gregaria]
MLLTFTIFILNVYILISQFGYPGDEHISPNGSASVVVTAVCFTSAVQRAALIFTASWDCAALSVACWCYQGTSRGVNGRRALTPPPPLVDSIYLDQPSPSPSPSLSSPQDQPSDLDVCPGSSFLEHVPVASQARWCGTVGSMLSSTATACSSSQRPGTWLSPHCRSQPHYMTVVRHMVGSGGRKVLA